MKGKLRKQFLTFVIVEIRFTIAPGLCISQAVLDLAEIVRLILTSTHAERNKRTRVEYMNI